MRASRRPRRLLQKLALALAVVVSVGLVSPAPAQAAAPTTRFGAQFHGLWAEWSDDQRRRALDELAASGATAVRIDVGWPMIEPRRGAIDYGWGVPLIDKVFAMARERNLRVLATLWLTPGWANGGRGDKVLPTDVADYARVAQFAANRWRNVEAWQVWNEPNLDAFLNPPDPVGYTRLLRAAHPAIKAGNPNARVVFGGTMYVDTPWIKRSYEAGARPFFDVMAVHPYQGDSSMPPEHPSDGNIWWLNNTRTLVDLMRVYGDSHKSIWYTEFGWSAHANTSSTPVWAKGVTEAQQADYFLRTMRYVQATYPQVSRAYWYTSRDKTTGNAHQDNFGLLRRDFSRKPVLRTAACAYRGIC